MASLYRKEGSPYYWMRFSHKGVRYQESTKKTREDHAQTVMEKRIAEVKGSGGYNDLFDRLLKLIDQQPKKKQELLRKDFASRLLSGANEKLLISEAFALYTAKPKKKPQSAVTNKRYKSMWDKFSEWLKENYPDVEYMHEITHGMADSYMTYAWGRGITERTYNGILLLIGHVFKTLAREAGISTNPTDGIEKMTLQTVSREKLSPKQLEDVCAKASGEIKTLFLIGLYTGLRMGDAATLQFSQCDLDKGIIRVSPKKTKASSNKTIEIPIHDVLRAVLLDIKSKSLGNSAYVLPGLAEQYKKHGHYVSQQVQQVFKDAGLETNSTREDGRGRRLNCLFGFHSLRHSFVSLCHANNIPQIAVMELVGHSSTAVHSVYMHGDNELRQRAIASLPDVTKGGE